MLELSALRAWGFQPTYIAFFYLIPVAADTLPDGLPRLCPRWLSNPVPSQPCYQPVRARLRQRDEQVAAGS